MTLAVAVGDAAGVGPIVTAHALAQLGDDRALVYGDAAQLSRTLASVGVEHGRLAAGARIELVDVGAVSAAAVSAHAPTPEAGAQALVALRAASDAVLSGRARALVTGPVSKEAIVASGTAFRGQTEYLAERAGLADDDVTMMFLGPRLRVALVTTHLRLSDVPAAVTGARVERTVRHLVEALLGLRPEGPVCIDVAGLNPHAGEGGLFGDEELRVIGPAVERMRPRLPASVRLRGPRAAEASFREAASGLVDGVVAMAHDQATIASKLLDWGSAVNVTWGLPFVRASVDHGVAYDAAAAGEASPEGMVAALALAQRLVPASRGAP